MIDTNEKETKPLAIEDKRARVRGIEELFPRLYGEHLEEDSGAPVESLSTDDKIVADDPSMGWLRNWQNKNKSKNGNGSPDVVEGVSEDAPGAATPEAPKIGPAFFDQKKAELDAIEPPKPEMPSEEPLRAIRESKPYTGNNSSDLERAAMPPSNLATDRVLKAREDLADGEEERTAHQEYIDKLRERHGVSPDDDQSLGTRLRAGEASSKPPITTANLYPTHPEIKPEPDEGRRNGTVDITEQLEGKQPDTPVTPAAEADRAPIVAEGAPQDDDIALTIAKDSEASEPLPEKTEAVAPEEIPEAPKGESPAEITQDSVTQKTVTEAGKPAETPSDATVAPAPKRESLLRKFWRVVKKDDDASKVGEIERELYNK